MSHTPAKKINLKQRDPANKKINLPICLLFPLLCLQTSDMDVIGPSEMNMTLLINFPTITIGGVGGWRIRSGWVQVDPHKAIYR